MKAKAWISLWVLTAVLGLNGCCFFHHHNADSCGCGDHGCGDHAGAAGGEYKSIFNGKDLTGWDGDPRLWSAQNGEIVGQTTTDKPAAANTFLIFRTAKLRDFDLKLNFKITNGNSGVQFRAQDLGEWHISGYQAEVANDRDDPDIGVGFIYHERGRGNIVHVGQVVTIDSEGKRHIIGKLADATALKG